MTDVHSVPREEVEEVIHEIEILEEAISRDIFYTRDPNDVAMALCLGMQLVKIKICKQAIFGKRYPQRTVLFGFSGHDETYRRVVQAKLNMQSSMTYRNVNIGEFRVYQGIIKTIIHSSF